MSLPWMNRLDFWKHLFTPMQRKLKTLFLCTDGVVFLIFHPSGSSFLITKHFLVSVPPSMSHIFPLIG